MFYFPLIGIEHLAEDEISEIREKCLARLKKAGKQKNVNKKAQAAINNTVVERKHNGRDEPGRT